MSKESVVDFLVAAKSGLQHKARQLQTLEADFLANEPIIFHEEIRNQIKRDLEFIVVNEVCINLGLDYETVQGIIEDVNIREYLE